MRIEDRLNEATTAVERQIESVPVRPVGVVQGRHRRQRTVAAMSATALLLTLIAGSAFLFTGTADQSGIAEPSDDDAITTPTESVAAAMMATSLITGDLDWQVVDATVVDLEDVFAWDGTFYALSTAPGKSGPDPDQDYSEVHYRSPQAIYSSGDGIAWDAELISDDLWVSDMDHHEGTLYAVGTAPGVSDSWNGPVEAQAAFTTDGGATWEQTDLPVIAAPPEGMGTVMSRAIGAKIAAGPVGIVVAINSRFGMGYGSFVPEEYRSAEMVDVYRTADGIEVTDWSAMQEAEIACAEALVSLQDGGVTLTTAPPTTAASPAGSPPSTVGITDIVSPSDLPVECDGLEDGSAQPGVVFAATWEELGVAEPPMPVFAEMFVSSDGRNWDVVSSPFGGGELIDLYATDTGFLAVEAIYARDFANTQSGIWSSPDGRIWERLNVPDGLSSISAIGMVKDQIALVGWVGTSFPAAASVFVSDDGGMTWETIDIPSLLELGDDAMVEISGVDFGPHGLTMVLFADGPDRNWKVLMTADLETWSDISPTDAAIDLIDAFLGSVADVGDNLLVSVTTSGTEPPNDYTTLIGAGL